MEFSVPAFVMISGALFLNPSKQATYSLFLNKYVKRVVLALVVFGLPMCFIEGFLIHDPNVFHFVCNWITGNSWAHIWYLYMLIGLYLMTPIIKPFVIGSTDKELTVALSVLFVLSSLLPTLRTMGINLNGYMLLPPYIFIYILGYWLCWRQKEVNLFLILVTLGICVSVIVWKCWNGIGSFGYADPVLIIMAAAFFLLFKQMGVDFKFASFCAPYCFGIYLVHPVFINFAYKFLEINSYYVVPLYGYMGTLFFILSLGATYVMMLVPWLKKKVL